MLVILGVGRTPYAMLANSWGGDIVAKAGGQLLTNGLTSASGIARISDEIVVQRNPDIIIAVPHGNSGNDPAARRVLPLEPELAQHAGREEQARVRRDGQPAAAAVSRRGGDHPQRPRQVLEELLAP